MNSRSKMAMERVWVCRVFTATTFLRNTCNLEFVAFQTVPTSQWRMRHRSSIMVSFVACVACIDETMSILKMNYFELILPMNVSR